MSTKVLTDAKWCFTTTFPTACTLPMPKTGSRFKTLSLSVSHVPRTPSTEDKGKVKQTTSPTVKLCCHKQENQQSDNINFLHVCVKSKSMHLVVKFQVLGHNESLGTPVSYGPTIHSVQQTQTV